MAMLGWFGKMLGLLIVFSFLLSYLGFAQPQSLPNSGMQGLGVDALNDDGFPHSWQVQDFDFTMLEPAAGTRAEPVTATTTGLTTNQLVSQPTMQASSATATPRPATYQVMRIDEMPRTSALPGGMASSTITVALPAPVSPTETTTPGLRPLGQVFPGTPATANAGMILSEQPLAGAARGLPGLAAYGPLTAVMPESLWLRAPQSIQQQRLKAATALPLRSKALKELWRRMLLANAAAPAEAAATPNTRPHWLAVRAETLEALGLYDAAWSLWREARPLVRQPGTPADLLQGWARASLLAGLHDEACSLVREQAAAGMVSDFWPSSAAVCAAQEMAGTTGAGGPAAALGLAIQLLPAATFKADPALLSALTGIRDNQSPRVGEWPIGSLAAATMVAAPQLLSASQLAGLPDVALRRVLGTVSLPPNVREQAALQLVGHTGAAADAAAWLELASSPTLPLQPQAAWPDAAVLAWAKALVQAGMNNPSITLVPELAQRVVPAALRDQNVSTALVWWGPYRTQTGLTPDQLRTRWQVYLALQLAQGLPVSDTLQAWLPVRGADAMANRRTLAVVAGMGQPVAAPLWDTLNQDASEQNDTLNLAWQNLVQDAANQQDSVAVLALLSEALRGQNAASAPPAVLQAGVAALIQVGQPEAALRLATEALTLPVATGASRVLTLSSPPILSPTAQVTATPVAVSRSQLLPRPASPRAPVVATPTVPKLPKRPTGAEAR